jgi:SAM-dependent methyltransferase
MIRRAPYEFAVEVHPPDWRFPAGQTWLAGWIKRPDGGPVTDVRARLHSRVILGLAGLPHPAFPAGPDAGFSFLFAPQPGATRLQLEAHGPDGRWEEFFCAPIAAAPGAASVAPRSDLAGSFGGLIIALLKRRLRTPAQPWEQLADEVLAGWVAEPLNAFPNLPFVGALEEPQLTGRFRYGVVPVTGWLAHPGARLARLTAVIDPLPPVALPHGLARRDIPGAFPALGPQADSAFAGEVALPASFAAPVLLKIFAELAAGGQHLAFAQRFTPQHHRSQGEMPPQVPADVFIRAVRALHRAAGRYALPRRGLLRAAWTFWSAYRSAPRYRPARACRGPSRFQPQSTGRIPASCDAPATTLIAPADDMLVRDAAPYFQIGREALELVQAAHALAGGGGVGAILDLPCGHGRVARWLRAAYPAAQLVVSDTQAPGVQFCIEHLHATGVPATLDGGHWTALPGPFDLIWCGSLLTHFGREDWVTHLQRFAERLAPRGVLVFTTHGQVALDKLQTGDKDYGLPAESITRLCADAVALGFGYSGYPATPGYGISVSQAEWIRELVARVTDLQVLAIHESAWDQHQDVVVCTRR